MLAIIGGTGLYAIEGVELVSEQEIETPFGKPSAPVKTLRAGDREFFFLPRHGAGHAFLPHEINYLANIFALKKAGARMVVGFSAVGSLREEIAPGDFTVPSQYLDLTKVNVSIPFLETALQRMFQQPFRRVRICPNGLQMWRKPMIPSFTSIRRMRVLKGLVLARKPRAFSCAEQGVIWWA